jgi:hypothetical protein
MLEQIVIETITEQNYVVVTAGWKKCRILYFSILLHYYNFLAEKCFHRGHAVA